MQLFGKNIDIKYLLTGFSIKRVAKVLFYFLAVATLIMICLSAWGVWSFFKEEDDWDDDYDSDYYTAESNSADCNVTGIELHGSLFTYLSDSDSESGEDIVSSEEIVYWIEDAEKDSTFKAILLEVDSYGGSPVAAEEVADALKRAEKPTVALIREGGVSAAYWAATGADNIFASKNSDVGSIGATMSYLDASRKNQLDGFNYVDLSSGKFKDTGNPDKPLSAEERVLLMRDVNILHNNFISAVAENRNLDIEKVRALADGSTLLGEMALENGLVDRIGGIFEVKEFLKEMIDEDVEICW